ncbi:MAG: ribonuclease P protein component [Chloroflexi bacterium RBG_16_50_9]|nr:MAG: ribonuclease P protein component [Chloroflexi bacterium RBG_16_50_9]
MRGEQHLTKGEQFGLVYDKGSSWVGKAVVMKALPNSLDLTRYGLVVSRRIGKAVVRNRVKRLLREILRQTPLQPGWDIVIISRSSAARGSYKSLGKSVRGLLTQAGLFTEENEEVCPRIN